MTDSDDMERFREQAEAGDAEAQFNLGVMYHTGDDVPQNNGRAVYWFCKAAEQGYAGAQYNLDQIGRNC